MKEGSLDFYATMRSLYRQKRRKDISGELESKDLSLSMLPIDVYEDEELKTEAQTEVQNVITTTMNLDNSNKEVKKPRYYNGILPSSGYPGFNESRVNLIE